MLVVCSDIHVLGSPLMSAEDNRMQDLASEFSKIFPGVTPRTSTAGGGDSPHTHPPLARPLAGRGALRAQAPRCPRKRPGVGTQTLVPLNFSAVVAPLCAGKNKTRGHNFSNLSTQTPFTATANFSLAFELGGWRSQACRFNEIGVKGYGASSGTKNGPPPLIWDIALTTVWTLTCYTDVGEI